MHDLSLGRLDGPSREQPRCRPGAQPPGGRAWTAGGPGKWLLPPAVAVSLVLGGAVTARLPAQETPASPTPAQATDTPPDTATRVYLVTAGPGARVWERFGHNGLWIDRPGPGDRLYHWGVFSFTQEDFWPRLITGRMLYAMVGTDPQRWIAANVAADRTVRVQEINLDRPQIDELVGILRSTDTDANRWYRYDYYRDNCSTRARDHLDRVLGGVIQARLSGPETERTFRWHTHRLLRRVQYAYMGTQILLGQPTDETLTRHQETFLPNKLAEYLPDVVGSDGEPIVLSDRIVYESESLVEPETSPSLVLPYLVGGSVLGVLLAALGVLFAAGRRWARIPLAIAGGGWSLVVGLLGVPVAFAWTFSESVDQLWNENALQAHPLWLVMAGFLLVFLFRGRFPRGAAKLAWTAAALSVTGVVIQILPWFYQHNGEVLALLVPVHLGLAWAVVACVRVAAERNHPPAA